MPRKQRQWRVFSGIWNIETQKTDPASVILIRCHDTEREARRDSYQLSQGSNAWEAKQTVLDPYHMPIFWYAEPEE